MSVSNQSRTTRSASRQNAPVPCVKWRTLGWFNQDAIFRELGGVAYRGRILGILIGYRIDLSVSGSWVDVCLQKRYYVVTAGPKGMVTFVRPRSKWTGVLTYWREWQEKTVWKRRRNHQVLDPHVNPGNRRECRKWTHVPSSST